MLVLTERRFIKTDTKLQSCHCEEPFDFAQDKLRDVAIYRMEPALARRDLYMLLVQLILHSCFSITTLIGARSGPGIASHSFVMTSINSSLLNATWY